ncbi:unnamed protein product [Periconia digitata]|uniref:Uncharacterized protein n=1 Tax=Periconia digitata TaxID=1303443 RepID=A0A9W4XQB5_9PLEO|nr:unnamed protein product [Periconia digitata]
MPCRVFSSLTNQSECSPPYLFDHVPGRRVSNAPHWFVSVPRAANRAIEFKLTTGTCKCYITTPSLGLTYREINLPYYRVLNSMSI